VVSIPAFHSVDRGSIPTYFQFFFFSISSFLYKTSNLSNHLPSKCRGERVISHIKGLPQKLTYYYRALGLTTGRFLVRILSEPIKFLEKKAMSSDY
jgi:hypothetical protein